MEVVWRGHGRRAQGEGRRWFGGLAVIAAVAAAAALTASGGVSPRLDLHVVGGRWSEPPADQPGENRLLVRVVLDVENHGWVSAHVRGWRPPPTEGITWDHNIYPAQLTLDPGERRRMRLRFAVHDCDQVEVVGADDVRLRAAGLLPWSVTRRIQLDGHHRGPPFDRDRPTSRDVDREPSWIYDAAMWPCTEGVES